MREILFRGKSVNDGRWVFGDLSNYGDYRAITTTNCLCQWWFMRQFTDKEQAIKAWNRRANNDN